MSKEIATWPIGIVHGGRAEASDDAWDTVESRIELDPAQFTAEAIAGLSEFSHVEVLYHFHKVAPATIVTGARHPRGNTNWPKVGIFAQRGKNRPNRIGATICALISVDGLTLRVCGLDAIDGTPVLDVKPWAAVYDAVEDARVPAWFTELMRGYF